jgi:hypothetical protein
MSDPSRGRHESWEEPSLQLGHGRQGGGGASVRRPQEFAYLTSSASVSLTFTFPHWQKRPRSEAWLGRPGCHSILQ